MPLNDQGVNVPYHRRAPPVPDLGGRKPAGGAGAKGISVAQSSRITSFDGLRGAAAFVVILYHYLCLLHPRLTPSMSEEPASLVDTPLNLAVNGAFAVAVFFVLSGFVIARTAERRTTALLPTVVARYLRLAVPAAASCLFAWVLLSFMPTSARELAMDAEIPSRWHDYTYQGELGSPFRAAYNGLVGIFNYGFSRWNNVLWTLKIELLGSIALYALYSLSRGRVRLALLFAGTVVLTSLTEPSYAAFGLGAALYEGWRSDALPRMIARLGPLAPSAVALSLAVGLLLAFPGDGFHIRNGLPPVDTAWMVGETRGYLHVFAAAFIVFGVLMSPVLAKCFSLLPLLWLGRVSFALYLVHVPILYTIIATIRLSWDGASALLLPLFIVTSLLTAELFTQLIDQPMLQVSARVRRFTPAWRRT